MLLVDARVGLSSTDGLGVFAQQFIAKGTPVWEQTPKLDRSLSQAEVDALSDRARRAFLHYSFWNSKLNVHVLCFDDARYMNHSDDPNTDGRRAVREIAEGEELTYAYGRKNLNFSFERTLGGPAVARLAASLADPDRHIRMFAAKVLSTIGADAAQAVPALCVALTDDEPRIRYYSAKALGRIGVDAQAAIEPLRAVSNDGDKNVAAAAATALGKIARAR